MNLSALQYADIYASAAALIDDERFPSCSTRFQSNGDSSSPRHVLIEQTIGGLPNRIEPIEKIKLRTFRLRPVFSDSLLSTEVLFTLPCKDNEDSIKKEESCNDNYPLGTLDFPITNNLQYRLHDPLPAYLSGHLYRAGLHTVIIVGNETHRNNANASLACKVHDKLHGTSKKNNVLQQPVAPCFIDSDISLGGNSRQKMLESLQLEPFRLTHICHRLNVISKADLVLCDSSGTAVDAIRSGVPAVFIADVPISFENLQVAVEAFLHHGSSEQLLADQQNTLKDILKTYCRHHYVMSNHSTLAMKLKEHLIPSHLNKVFKGESDSIRIEDDLILCTQQTLRSNQNTTTRLKSGVERSRRKFQKFRESPSRFMKESQSRVLRSLVTNRIQQ